MRKKLISEEEKINLIKDYSENLLSSNILSVKYNIPKRSVLKLLRDNNIKLRNSGRQYIGGKSMSDKRYHKKNKEKLDMYFSKWQKNNINYLREYHKKWRKENNEKYKETKRNYEKRRKSNDPIYKLISNFRTAIYTVLKENNLTKNQHYFDILGYTSSDLRMCLENQFTDGMTWENYGKWHVDHKLPITSFNFTCTSDDEFKRCWSLDNLQPMWGSENISKSNKIKKV